MNAKRNWIKGVISSHEGGLHRSLHIPPGQPISADQLDRALKRGGKVAKQAELAKTLRSFH